MESQPFEVGDWVRWTTPLRVQDGRVIEAGDVSIIVRWLGGDQQVFPVVEGYVKPYGGHEYRLERIPRPPKASSIERDAKRGVMSVARAASILGTTPKNVRAQLRSGALKGVHKDGRWVGVELPDGES